MAPTFKELKHMTLAELKEVAAGMDDEAVEGYTQLNKDHLLEALCKALHIEMHEHHEVVGIDKAKIKNRIKALKKERDEAIKKKNKKKMIEARRKIKDLKKRLRSAMV